MSRSNWVADHDDDQRCDDEGHVCAAQDERCGAAYMKGGVDAIHALPPCSDCFPQELDPDSNPSFDSHVDDQIDVAKEDKASSEES